MYDDVADLLDLIKREIRRAVIRQEKSEIEKLLNDLLILEKNNLWYLAVGVSEFWLVYIEFLLDNWSEFFSLFNSIKEENPDLSLPWLENPPGQIIPNDHWPVHTEFTHTVKIAEKAVFIFGFDPIDGPRIQECCNELEKLFNLKISRPPLYESLTAFQPTIESFQTKLAQPDSSKDQIYLEYISNAISFAKNGSFVISLYERAIHETQINAKIVESYFDWSRKMLFFAFPVIQEYTSRLHTRLLQMLPESETLNIYKMRHVEQCKELNFKNLEKIKNIKTVEKILLEYLRQNISKSQILNDIKQIEEFRERIGKSENFDLDVKILCEILFEPDFENQVNSITCRMAENATKAQDWMYLLYFLVMRKFTNRNDVSKARNYFERARFLVSDAPLLIYNAFVEFEWNIGDLENLEFVESQQKSIKELSESNVQSLKNDDERTLIVKHVRSSQEDELRKLLSKYGVIERIRFLKPRNRKLYGDNTMAFVKYTTCDSVNVAVESKIQTSEGRILNLERPKSIEDTEPLQEIVSVQERKEKTLFVANLGSKIGDQELREIFQNIREIRIVRNKDGEPRGFAYLEMNTIEDANEALAKDQFKFKGRVISVKKSDPEKAKNKQNDNIAIRGTRVRDGDPCSVVIANIPYGTTRSEISRLLRRVEISQSEIVNIHLAKAVSIVKMTSEEQAQEAVKKLQEETLGDRQLRVSIQLPTIKEPVKKKPCKERDNDYFRELYLAPKK